MKQNCHFQRGLAECKHKATPLSSYSINTTLESFQKRYITLLYVKGLKSYQQKCKWTRLKRLHFQPQDDEKNWHGRQKLHLMTKLMTTYIWLANWPRSWFCKILQDSTRFYKIPEDPARFWQILSESSQYLWMIVTSGEKVEITDNNNSWFKRRQGIA